MLLKYFSVSKRQPNPQLIITRSITNQTNFVLLSRLVFFCQDFFFLNTIFFFFFKSQTWTLSFNYKLQPYNYKVIFFYLLHLLVSFYFFHILLTISHDSEPPTNWCHTPWLRASDELMSYAIAPTNSTMKMKSENDKKKCGVSHNKQPNPEVSTDSNFLWICWSLFV